MADVGNGAEAEEAEEVSSGAPVRLRLSGAEAAGWYRLHSSCHVLLFTPLFLFVYFPPSSRLHSSSLRLYSSYCLFSSLLSSFCQ